MTRLLFFNDPHFSRHAPECRAPSYPHEILDKFHELADKARKLNVDAIGCSGDWFHRKGKVTFAEANDVLAVLRSWREKGLDVIGILGNHDIAGHSLDSLDGRAVGTLVHSKVLTLLDYGPWTSPDGEVVVTGTSYFHGCDADDEARLRMYGYDRTILDTSKVHVHVAHGTLVKREFFEEFTRMEDLVGLLHEHDRLPDVIVCGHLHYSEGVVEFDRPDGTGKVAMCRVGSLGRVSSDDLERQVQAVLIATKGRAFVCKPISVGGEPKRNEQHEGGDGQSRDEHEARIQSFVRVLREEAETWSMVDHDVLLRRLAEEMNEPEEVLQAAIRAVERRQ